MSYRADHVTINAYNVTPSDTVKNPGFAIRVGVAGDVALMPSYQEGKATPVAAIYYNCYAGETIPLSFSRVMATNTTATNLTVYGPV